MGCESYVTGISKRGETKIIRFSEVDDEYSCLCTFADGDESLSPEQARSLALLGAAVVLAHRGAYDGAEAFVYLSSMVPDWVQKGIDAAIPVELEEE